MSPEILCYAQVYSHAKSALGHKLGLNDDLLHVHVGLAPSVLAALLTGRRMRLWWPLLIVAAFAVANEVIDYLGPDPWSDRLSALDLANTLVWR